MKLNKLIFGISLLIFASLLTSCNKDFLNTTKEDSYTSANYWKTTDQAQMYVTSLYTYLRDDWWEPFLTCASDDSYSWSNWPSDVQLLANGTGTAASGTINHFWSTSYKAIAAANIANANISKVPNIDPTVEKELIGQARFIRDYFYSQLINLYGNVPLITHLETINEFKAAATPKDSIVDFIVKDIDSYYQNLPVSYPSSEWGRITRGAALALKARVLLYSGQWTAAAAAAKQVMDLGVYSIDPDYESLFNGTNEQSPEIILSAVYDDLSKSSLATWVCGPYVGGWSQVVPTQSLVDSYECTDGQSISTSPLYDPKHPYENRDPRLKMTIVVPTTVVNGVTVDVADPNSPYTLGKNNASYTGYYYKKYTATEISGPYYANCTNDIILLRYAGVLLTYAEAKIMANDIDQSVYDAIDEVRGRADVNMPPIPTGETQAQLINAVRYEWRVEFAMEPNRLYDIRRWKIADQVMNGKVYGILNNFDPSRADYGQHVLVETRTFNPNKDYVWGYPQSEVDIDPNLTQNPGW